MTRMAYHSDEEAEVEEPKALRLPVVSLAAEYLVMGHLLRRNILAYKAPPGNEGYDLICIHPNPRHAPKDREHSQVRVQVKSRYATDCNRAFLIKEVSLDAFDFLVVAFLNIGKFYGRNDGATGEIEPEFYTLPASFVREHHDATTTWHKVKLRGLGKEIAKYKGTDGFEQIAEWLGVPRPMRRS
jgi:hypothetical protein